MENKRKKQTKIYETVEKNLRRKLYLLYLYHNNNTLRAKLTNLLRVMDRKKLFWLPLENAILSCYVRVVVLFSNVRRSNMMTLQFSECFSKRHVLPFMIAVFEVSTDKADNVKSLILLFERSALSRFVFPLKAPAFILEIRLLFNNTMFKLCMIDRDSILLMWFDRTSKVFNEKPSPNL